MCTQLRSSDLLEEWFLLTSWNIILYPWWYCFEIHLACFECSILSFLLIGVSVVYLSLFVYLFIFPCVYIYTQSWVLPSICLYILFCEFIYTYVFKRKWTEGYNFIDWSQCRDILPAVIKLYSVYKSKWELSVFMKPLQKQLSLWLHSDTVYKVVYSLK